MNEPIARDPTPPEPVTFIPTAAEMAHDAPPEPAAFISQSQSASIDSESAPIDPNESAPFDPDLEPTPVPAPRRFGWRQRPMVPLARWLLALLLLLLIVGAFYFLWRNFFSAGAVPAGVAGQDLTFAPAQPEEFLIVIAPFRRDGGEPQAIGGTLANDLRETVAGTGVRIETLPRAPDPDDIPGILQTFGPRLLITGAYNGEDITPIVDLIPPERLPIADTASSEVVVASALLPSLQPVRFDLDAPQGNERPLRYLQAWILGQTYFWRGDYAEAYEALQRAKTLLPRQIPTAYRTAMDRFASSLNWQLGYIVGPVQGDWRAGRDLFRESMRQTPGETAPALGYAAALAQLNDLPQASSILRETLRSHPDAWQVYFALAEIALQQEDVTTAFANYASAIALLEASTSPPERQALGDIYFHRGYYLLNHDDPTAAQQDLQKALDLGRNDIYVQGSLGWAAYQAGDYETAVRASAAARQLAPERPDLAFNEALHLLAAGQVDAARTAYGEAIDLTLTFPDVLTRSTYFGVAYRDLTELAASQPDLGPAISELQERIDIANG